MAVPKKAYAAVGAFFRRLCVNGRAGTGLHGRLVRQNTRSIGGEPASATHECSARGIDPEDLISPVPPPHYRLKTRLSASPDKAAWPWLLNERQVLQNANGSSNV